MHYTIPPLFSIFSYSPLTLWDYPSDFLKHDNGHFFHFPRVNYPMGKTSRTRPASSGAHGKLYILGVYSLVNSQSYCKSLKENRHIIYVNPLSSPRVMFHSHVRFITVVLRIFPQFSTGSMVFQTVSYVGGTVTLFLPIEADQVLANLLHRRPNACRIVGFLANFVYCGG